MKNYCGLDCAQCPAVDSCPGCASTGGKPFGGTCVLGECCKAQGCETPGSCFSGTCAVKEQLIREFNDLHIPHMVWELAYCLGQSQLIQFRDTVA